MQIPRHCEVHLFPKEEAKSQQYTIVVDFGFSLKLLNTSPVLVHSTVDRDPSPTGRKPGVHKKLKLN